MEDGMAGADTLGRASLDEARRHIELQNWEQAVDACRQAMADPATVADATALMGVVAYFLDDIGQAIALFNRVATLPDASTDIPEVLAVLYAMTGFLQEALFHGKLATARPLDNRIIPSFGGRLPPFASVFYGMQERPLVQRGRRLLERGDCAGAIGNFQQQLALDSRNVEALDGLTEAYLENGQARSAIDLLRVLRLLVPDEPRYVARLAQALTAVGELSEGRACHDLAVLMAPTIANLAARLRDVGAAADAVAVAGARRQLEEALVAAPRPPTVSRSGRRLNVGFLCTRMAGDDVRLVAGILRRIDKTRVSAFAYGHGALSIPRNVAFQGTVAHWRDIRGLDPQTTAAIIRGDGIDVLVDVCGLLAPEQLAVLAARPAPVQVAWLHGQEAASPATVDVVVGGAAAGVAEWPLGCAAWPVAVDEAAAVERDGPCTFGADATLGELNPDVALAWSRILLALPGSRLALRDRDLRDPDNARRLIGLFGDFGVAHRVEVLSDLPLPGFLREIDVALVPFPAGAAFVAAQAGALGIPVIALAAAGPVAALLRDSGLTEGLATDATDYVDKAVALAGRRGASAGRAAFDPDGLAQALADAFERLHDRESANG